MFVSNSLHSRFSLPYSTEHIHVNYFVGIALATFIAPITIGVFIRYKWPKQAKKAITVSVSELQFVFFHEISTFAIALTGEKEM